MLYQGALANSGQSFLRLTLSSVQGQGHILPRLLIDFQAHTYNEQITVEIERLTLSILFKDELICRGELMEPGSNFISHESRLVLELPISRDAIKFVSDHAAGNVFQFNAEFSGAIRVFDGRQGGSNNRIVIQPHNSRMSFAIPRLDWMTTVLEPLGMGKYITMIIPVPSGAESATWAKALGHLQDAEKQFAIGNDPGVFQYCRAIFEKGVLEGAPKQIFDKIDDPKKKDQLDKLLLEAVNYFHSGRHVSAGGTQQGDFPVDHRDAEFALALSKIWLAYLAKLLTQ